MMIRGLMTSLIFSAVLVTASPASETLESIEQKAKENWLKVKSLSATTRLESERIYPDRNIKKLTTGNYFFLRDEEGREMVRQELETNQDTEMTLGKDKPMTTIPNSEKRTMVSDGRKVRMMSEGMRGNKAGIMFHKGSGIVIGGVQLFESIRKESEVQVLPDSRFEGREAWAVQAVQHKGYQKTTYLIDKEWGFLLQRVAYSAKDADDVPATTYTISKFQVNANDVVPGQFKFEFPPGMEVNDETKDE